MFFTLAFSKGAYYAPAFPTLDMLKEWLELSQRKVLNRQELSDGYEGLFVVCVHSSKYFDLGGYSREEKIRLFVEH